MKEIDWANLSFGYMKTDYNVRINFRNGATSQSAHGSYLSALWSGSF